MSLRLYMGLSYSVGFMSSQFDIVLQWSSYNWTSKFLHSKFRVIIQIIGTPAFEVEVKRKDTIKKLRSRIKAIYPMRIDEYTILYNSRTVDDNGSLFSSGITNDCLLLLIPRQRWVVLVFHLNLSFKPETFPTLPIKFICGIVIQYWR